jgi:ABC-2 type transport system ATP-binding protein
MSRDVVQAQDLTRRFGDFVAVDRVSFQVSRGEIFGFLGSNGAGKITTINMLTGLARPDAGSSRIASIDCTGNPKAAQHVIGVVPDESNLYPELTGFDNPCFCASLDGMRKKARETHARELLDVPVKAYKISATDLVFQRNLSRAFGFPPSGNDC